jgi:hypothetical protein
MATLPYSWVFVTPATTGAMYENEAETISISLDLMPLYIMFALMCLFNVALLVWLVYDRTEFKFLRAKVDDGVVPLQPRAEPVLEENVIETTLTPVGFDPQTQEVVELSSSEEEDERPPKFQNDNLSSDEFERKMLK